MRVAAIEVGSRAVRLLVAEIADGTLTQVVRDVEDVDLMRALVQGTELAAVDETRQVIDRFRRRAGTAGAERVRVFGTEAVRQIVARGHGEGLGEMDVLSKEDEAFCSLVASARDLPAAASGKRLAAIDHGNGSLELAVGWNGPTLEMLGFLSLPLGSETLLSLLADSGFAVEGFEEAIRARLVVGMLPDVSVEEVVIQGSVATKCAWLAVRRDLEDRYDARRVHGCRMNLDSLRQVIALAKKTPRSGWRMLSKAVNPRDVPSDQFERLFTGCILLERLMVRLGREQFVVSAHGTRHGFIWKLAEAA